MPRVKTKQIERAVACERLMWAVGRMRAAAQDAVKVGGTLNKKSLESLDRKLESLQDDAQAKLDEVSNFFDSDDFHAFHMELDEAQNHWMSQRPE